MPNFICESNGITFSDMFPIFSSHIRTCKLANV